MRAKLINQGDDQVVVLPKEVRLPGDEADVTMAGDMVLLRPVEAPRRIPWELIDALADEPFPGREQPPMPDDPPLFDE